MAQVEMVMPKMGESIMEGTILSWLKKEGDHIDQDESVLEVATDKVDTEVPSAHAGILKKILAKEGEVVEVGKPIAIIVTEDQEENEKPSSSTEGLRESKDNDVTSQAIQDNTKQPVQESAKTTSERFYSPLVRNIAKQENIRSEERRVGKECRSRWPS